MPAKPSADGRNPGPLPVCPWSGKEQHSHKQHLTTVQSRGDNAKANRTQRDGLRLALKVKVQSDSMDALRKAGTHQGGKWSICSLVGRWRFIKSHEHKAFGQVGVEEAMSATILIENARVGLPMGAANPTICNLGFSIAFSNNLLWLGRDRCFA